MIIKSKEQWEEFRKTETRVGQYSHIVVGEPERFPCVAKEGVTDGDGYAHYEFFYVDEARELIESNTQPCTACKGRGSRLVPAFRDDGPMVAQTCSICHGSKVIPAAVE